MNGNTQITNIFHDKTAAIPRNLVFTTLQTVQLQIYFMTKLLIYFYPVAGSSPALVLVEIILPFVDMLTT